MNRYTEVIIQGQDAILKCFLRSPVNGEGENLTPANIVVSAASLETVGHSVAIPSNAIIKGQAYQMPNQFNIILPRTISQTLLRNMMYNVKATVEYPDPMFPDNKRVVIYEIENALQVLK